MSIPQKKSVSPGITDSEVEALHVWAVGDDWGVEYTAGKQALFLRALAELLEHRVVAGCDTTALLTLMTAAVKNEWSPWQVTTGEVDPSGDEAIAFLTELMTFREETIQKRLTRTKNYE